MFTKIGFINLYSQNNKNLIHFYRDIVGVPVQENQNENSSWYGFATEGVTLAIEPTTNKANYPFVYNKDSTVLIQFIADDLEELEAMNVQLESRGVILATRSKQMSYGTITNFVDPDGNLIEILCEKYLSVI
jgi:predicted enzyme related to lactoylglutathione lyase